MVSDTVKTFLRSATPIFAILVGTAMFAIVLLWWNSPSGYDQRADFAKTIAQAAAAATLLVGLWFTNRTVQNSQETLELSHRSHDSDRFSKATEQLGHDKTSVQIGGLFTLQALFFEAKADRTAIFNTIHHYVNDVATFDPYDDEARKVAASNPAAAGLTVVSELLASPEYRSLGSGGKVPLWGCNFNFAELGEGDLSEASFMRSTLRNATFTALPMSGTDFTSADLTGVTFEGCDLSGATFNGAILSGAKFIHGHDRLVLTNGGRYKWDTSWELEGTDFSGATFILTDFSHTDLSKAIGLTWAELDHAILTKETKLPPQLCESGCLFMTRNHVNDLRLVGRLRMH